MRYPSGDRSAPTTSALENASPGPAASRSSSTATLSRCHTSSWSHSSTTSPRHRPTACSKFLVTPNCRAFRTNLTGIDKRLAKAATAAGVSSDDPSSQTTTSSTARDWSAIDWSCSTTNGAPL
jgi:hypothetical protein